MTEARIMTPIQRAELHRLVKLAAETDPTYAGLATAVDDHLRWLDQVDPGSASGRALQERVDAVVRVGRHMGLMTIVLVPPGDDQEGLVQFWNPTTDVVLVEGLFPQPPELSGSDDPATAPRMPISGELVDRRMDVCLGIQQVGDATIN